jgi:hypothetical protein
MCNTFLEAGNEIIIWWSDHYAPLSKVIACSGDSGETLEALCFKTEPDNVIKSDFIFEYLRNLSVGRMTVY